MNVCHWRHSAHGTLSQPPCRSESLTPSCTSLSGWVSLLLISLKSRWLQNGKKKKRSRNPLMRLWGFISRVNCCIDMLGTEFARGNSFLKSSSGVWSWRNASETHFTLQPGHSNGLRKFTAMLTGARLPQYCSSLPKNPKPQMPTSSYETSVSDWIYIFLICKSFFSHTQSYLCLSFNPIYSSLVYASLPFLLNPWLLVRTLYIIFKFGSCFCF